MIVALTRRTRGRCTPSTYGAGAELAAASLYRNNNVILLADIDYIQKKNTNQTQQLKVTPARSTRWRYDHLRLPTPCS